MGFVTEGELKRVSLPGGTVLTVADLGGPAGFRGTSWGLDDTIVFGTVGSLPGTVARRGGGRDTPVAQQPV